MSKPRIIKSIGRAFSKEQREELAAEDESKALEEWNKFTENFKKEFNVRLEPEVTTTTNAVNGVVVVDRRIRIVSNRRFE